MNKLFDRQKYVNDEGEVFTFMREVDQWCCENKYGTPSAWKPTKHACRKEIEKAHGKLITYNAYLRKHFPERFRAFKLAKKADRI